MDTDTQPPTTVLYLVPHRLTHSISGLWWFYFTKALNVHAKACLGPRGLGWTDIWLQEGRDTNPCPEAMLCALMS